MGQSANFIFYAFQSIFRALLFKNCCEREARNLCERIKQVASHKRKAQGSENASAKHEVRESEVNDKASAKQENRGSKVTENASALGAKRPRSPAGLA